MATPDKRVIEYRSEANRRSSGSTIINCCLILGLCTLINLLILFSGTISPHGNPRLTLGMLPYLRITSFAAGSMYVVDWLNLTITLAMTLAIWLAAAFLMRRLLRGTPLGRHARPRNMRRFGSHPA